MYATYNFAVGASNLLSIALNDIVCSIYFKIVLILLLLEAGDIERNPGHNTINNSLSILHCNIRSIRNKLDYITENLLDFDILCFSESHLDANISTDSLIMSSKYDIPYRKDRTNHGGGLLMYLSCELAHTRILANVIPILKKGDKSQPSNYRPVALLSCIGKLQERIVFLKICTTFS